MCSTSNDISINSHLLHTLTCVAAVKLNKDLFGESILPRIYSVEEQKQRPKGVNCKVGQKNAVIVTAKSFTFAGTSKRSSGRGS